jgi:hypothetical protein
VEEPRNSFSFAVTALAAVSLAALSGCGSYISEYAPPADGRARAIWLDGKVVVDVADPVPAECAAEAGLYSNQPPSSYRSSSRTNVHVHGGFWVPVYFGPRIVVVRRGVAPAPHIHTVRRSPSSASIGGGGSGGSIRKVSGSGGSSSGGGGGGGDAGKVLLVSLAVIALLALPAIAVGLSVGRTEPERETALAIDQVNAYNDLARTPGSPCAVFVPEAPAQ